MSHKLATIYGAIDDLYQKIRIFQIEIIIFSMRCIRDYTNLRVFPQKVLVHHLPYLM